MSCIGRCGGDAERMAARILEIVEARGKMHNPDTDSGGILMGTVTAVGERLDLAAARRGPDRDPRAP